MGLNWAPTEFRGNKWCCPGNTPWALVGPFPSPEAEASGAGPAQDASEEAAPREVSLAKGWRSAEEAAPREVSLAKRWGTTMAQGVRPNYGPTRAQLGPNPRAQLGPNYLPPRFCDFSL